MTGTTADAAADQVAERVPPRLASRDNHLLLRVVVAVVLVGLLALVAAFFVQRFMARERDAAQDRTIVSLADQSDANAAAAQELAAQVRELGGIPRVSAPAPGERGDTGPRGDTGSTGQPGQPGVPGPPGTPGTDGATGAPGGPGTDGQPGEPGPAGSQGDPGPAGSQGERGAPGANGEPPAGWTWLDGDGRTQSCTREPESPDTAPTYRCTTDPPPETVPSSTPDTPLWVPLNSAR